MKLPKLLRRSKTSFRDWDYGIVTSVEDFFRYYFVDRMVNIGKSVALLTKRGFYHEAGIAARTAVEGQSCTLRLTKEILH